MPDASAAIPVLAPRGDLDLATSRDLGSQLSELSGESTNAVLDLTGVSFMDSMGLGVVLKAVNRFRRQDKQLVLVVEDRTNVARLLELSGTRGQVTSVESRDAAVALAGASR